MLRLVTGNIRREILLPVYSLWPTYVDYSKYRSIVELHSNLAKSVQKWDGFNINNDHLPTPKTGMSFSENVYNIFRKRYTPALCCPKPPYSFVPGFQESGSAYPGGMNRLKPKSDITQLHHENFGNLLYGSGMPCPLL